MKNAILFFVLILLSGACQSGVKGRKKQPSFPIEFLKCKLGDNQEDVLRILKEQDIPYAQSEGCIEINSSAHKGYYEVNEFGKMFFYFDDTNRFRAVTFALLSNGYYSSPNKETLNNYRAMIPDIREYLHRNLVRDLGRPTDTQKYRKDYNWMEVWSSDKYMAGIKYSDKFTNGVWSEKGTIYRGYNGSSQKGLWLTFSLSTSQNLHYFFHNTTNI